MSKPSRVDAEAEEELLTASQWYDQQMAGLGSDFVRAAHDAVERIAAFPSSGALFPHVPEQLQVRRMLFKRFPYAVVYIELTEEIRVLAFAHTRKKPGYWLERHPR